MKKNQLSKLEQYFPTAAYPPNITTFLEDAMARLPEGEKEKRLSRVERLLNRFRLGLFEQEVAEEMDWDRRTTNNYLRELDKQEKAHRNGRKWFPD